MDRHAHPPAAGYAAVDADGRVIGAQTSIATHEKLKQMFNGLGPDAVLECVGTRGSMETAIRAVRPAGKVGYVGAPAGGSALDMSTMYFNNVGVDGGIALVRDYIPELLPDILNGTIRPGKVLDLPLPLAEVADAYRAMDERRAIKVILRSHA